MPAAVPSSNPQQSDWRTRSSIRACEIARWAREVGGKASAVPHGRSAGSTASSPLALACCACAHKMRDLHHGRYLGERSNASKL